MAEEEAAAGAAKGGFGFLTKKLGPLPVGVWVAAAGGIWWFLQKRQKGGAGQGGQTDPAGNVGSIDPATGYVYGSQQDTAALGQNGSLGSGGGGTSGSGGSTVGGTYADNDAWARAAINYLVGLGVDPTAANSAIEQFLASQALTTQQQADVNQAIQRLGAPPNPPQPGTAPTPIVNPPSPGTVYATNPPTGLSVGNKTRSSLALKWNSSVNAKGYKVSWGTTSAATTGSTTVAGTATSTTLNGLQPGKLYYIRVQATPAKTGAGFASAQASTLRDVPPTPVPHPVPVPVPHPVPTPVPNPPQSGRPEYVRAAPGESFGSIAQKYHIPGGGMALYEYNLNTPQHSDEAKALIRERGPDHVVINEQVFLPQ